MTSADPRTGFSLAYELRPDDFKDFFGAQPKRKFLRTRRLFIAVMYTVIGAILTAFAVTLDLKAGGNQSSGAPGWIYGVTVIAWGGVVYSGFVLWRLSPSRLARRTWDENPSLHGRHHENVGPSGVFATAPDGSQTLTPWSVFDRVTETGIAFNLFDHDDRVRCVLPKRGLASPDLIPALRKFLRHSVDGQSSMSEDEDVDPGR
jgi:hypothetical protein